MTFSRFRRRVWILLGGERPACRVARGVVVLMIATAAPTLRADVTELDHAGLRALIAAGVPVIDVRREDEWRERGVIAGSHLVTFFDADGRYDVEAWLAGIAGIADPDEPVVLVCAHGVRSRRIADLLDTRLGFTAVHNVAEGIEGWRANDGPVEPHAP